MVVLVRILLVVVLIVLGIFSYSFIADMQRPPAESDAAEIPLPVTGIRLSCEDIRVTLNGYGTARARTRVEVSPEVSGQVVEIHPRLETGEVISMGEILFRIDRRTYQLRLDQSSAEIERRYAEKARIGQLQKNDTRRLALNRRARDLAASEFERAAKLLKKDKVGSISTVELLEKNLTLAEDQVVAIENALALYPIQMKEIDAALKTAQVALDTAALDLEKTCVKAPFDARLENVALEKSQVISPGRVVLTLVDDSLLDIPVPFDSREISIWFPFGGDSASPDGKGADGAAGNWFALKPTCFPSVSWTENPDNFSWMGSLARIERFNAETSTAVVVVAVANDEEGRDSRLVEGMFCSVSIPGRIARQVFRVPSGAVSHEHTVFLSIDSRLRSFPVEVVYRGGDDVFIRGDIAEGSVLVTTRIASPIEKALLDVSISDSGENEAE
jgi:membrane fusion protein, multidrug efflux system